MARAKKADGDLAKQPGELTLTVTCKRAGGFRRAGRLWVGSAQVPRSELSDAQWADIQAEPMLVVTSAETDAEPVGDEA